MVIVFGLKEEEIDEHILIEASTDFECVILMEFKCKFEEEEEFKALALLVYLRSRFFLDGKGGVHVDDDRGRCSR